MTRTSTYLLYFVFALGACSLLMLMPRGKSEKKTAGVIVGAAALIGLLILFQLERAAAQGSRGYFYIFSLIALGGAVRVITHTKPVYSAIYFVLVVVAVAALLVLETAEFLAVALIIIYAGAILVTYLFVIMLAQHPDALTYDTRVREPFLAILAGFVLTGVVASKSVVIQPQALGSGQAVSATSAGVDDKMIAASNTLGVGSLIMTKYVVALELSGILLLISMVGAIALSRKKIPPEPYLGAHLKIGIAGKEAEPF